MTTITTNFRESSPLTTLLFRFLFLAILFFGFSTMVSADEDDLPPLTLVFDDMEHGNPFGNGWFAFGGSVGGGGIGPNPVDIPPFNGGSFSLETGWGGISPGFYGGFGRTFPLDLTGVTHFNFWINPDGIDARGRPQEYVLEINLQDDDNNDGIITPGPSNDDEFQYNLTVGPPGSGAEVISGDGWQLVSIPLADFFDDNSFIVGGNGILDADPGNGVLISIVWVIISSGSDATFRTDYWHFTNYMVGIPTLTQWGIIALALILMIVGVVYLKRTVPLRLKGTQ